MAVNTKKFQSFVVWSKALKIKREVRYAPHLVLLATLGALFAHPPFATSNLRAKLGAVTLLAPGK